MRHRHWVAAVAVAAVLGLAGTAGADETTFCNFFITTLPYTIAAQGHYCFSQNLSTAITTGNAIEIQSDFVVLDLNNFKLGGGSAGLGTNTVGVFATAHRNITIRNGNIRGFRVGIELAGSTSNSGGHVIENNVLDGNTVYGAYLVGDAMVVRNNVISNTGGATPATYATALYAGSSGSLIRDNVISNVFATTSNVEGIWAPSSDDDHNLISLGSTTTGIKYGTAWGYNRDNTVFGATNTGDAFYFYYAMIGHNFSNP